MSLPQLAVFPMARFLAVLVCARRLNCLRRRSGGVWKPEVTFFGEALAPRVGRTLELDRAKADLLLVIGTSLAVAPISKVMGWLPAAIPQILVNRCDA